MMSRKLLFVSIVLIVYNFFSFYFRVSHELFWVNSRLFVLSIFVLSMVIFQENKSIWGIYNKILIASLLLSSVSMNITIIPYDLIEDHNNQTIKDTYNYDNEQLILYIKHYNYDNYLNYEIVFTKYYILGFKCSNTIYINNLMSSDEEKKAEFKKEVESISLSDYYKMITTNNNKTCYRFNYFN